MRLSASGFMGNPKTGDALYNLVFRFTPDEIKALGSREVCLAGTVAKGVTIFPLDTVAPAHRHSVKTHTITLREERDCSGQMAIKPHQIGMTEHKFFRFLTTPKITGRAIFLPADAFPAELHQPASEEGGRGTRVGYVRWRDYREAMGDRTEDRLAMSETPVQIGRPIEQAPASEPGLLVQMGMLKHMLEQANIMAPKLGVRFEIDSEGKVRAIL